MIYALFDLKFILDIVVRIVICFNITVCFRNLLLRSVPITPFLNKVYIYVSNFSRVYLLSSLLSLYIQTDIERSIIARIHPVFGVLFLCSTFTEGTLLRLSTRTTAFKILDLITRTLV